MQLVPVLYFLIFGILPYNYTSMDNVDKNLLLGKFKPEAYENFVKVTAPYTQKDGIYLQKETYDAFRLMFDAAKKDGISLTIISATRNFDRQKVIWENKWNGTTLVGGKNLKTSIPDPVERARKILTYSSMPGTSRHHWGTDIDINSVTNSYFQSAKGLKEYDWLVSNASDFGFCQPYKMKGTERMSGHEDEPWHWSYLPLSNELTNLYVQYITYSDIKGFQGDLTAEKIDVIKNFVLGIHTDCIKD